MILPQKVNSCQCNENVTNSDSLVGDHNRDESSNASVSVEEKTEVKQN